MLTSASERWSGLMLPSARRIPWSKLKRLPGGNFVIYLTIALFILSWLYKIAAMKDLFWRG